MFGRAGFENVPEGALQVTSFDPFVAPPVVADNATLVVPEQTTWSGPAFTDAKVTTTTCRFKLVADPQAFTAVTEIFFVPVV